MVDFLKRYKKELNARKQLPKSIQEKLGDGGVKKEDIKITIGLEEVDAILYTLDAGYFIFVDPIKAMKAGLEFLDGAFKGDFSDECG